MYNYIEKVLDNPTAYNWIVFGGGGYGRAFIENYCLTGILPMPKYVCDNDKSRWNTEFIAGLMIADPSEIMREDYQKTIIVAATHWMAIVDQIRHMGGYYFAIFTSKCIEDILYIKNNIGRFDAVERMLEDELSRDLYHTKIQDFRRGILYDPSPFSCNPYYGNDVISSLDDKEVIVAGGCYNGDHIDRALDINPNVKFYSFEPNKKYADLLRDKYSNNENVIVKEYGLFDENTDLQFDNSADVSAHVAKMIPGATDSSDKLEKIHAVRMDDAVNDDVSLIWMDIEGSEIAALKGAERTIRSKRPKLAICVYHMIEHYVEIAELIKEYNPDYKLYFRHYSTMESESVLYAL